MEFGVKGQLNFGRADDHYALSPTYLLGGIIDEPLLLVEHRILGERPAYKL